MATITKEQIADYIINSPSLMVDDEYEYSVFYNFEKSEFTYTLENFYETVDVYAKADYLEKHEKELNEQAKLEAGEDFETENEWKYYKKEHSCIDSEIAEKMRNYIDETEDRNFKPFMQLCDYLAYKLNEDI